MLTALPLEAIIRSSLIEVALGIVTGQLNEAKNFYKFSFFMLTTIVYVVEYYVPAGKRGLMNSLVAVCFALLQVNS